MNREDHDQTPLLPEVLQAFTAVETSDRTRARRRRWRIGALGLVAVAASGTAVAATLSWNPLRPAGPDRYLTGRAPATFTDGFAVLRREQSAADQGPVVTAFLERIAGSDHGSLPRRPYVSGIRLLRDLPVGGGVQVGPGGGPAAEALRAANPPTRRTLLVAPGWAPDPDDSQGAGDEPLLCLWTLSGTAREPSRQAGGSSGCDTPERARRFGLTSGGFDGGELYGLVPDGVSAVRATTDDGQAVRSRVERNSFLLIAPGRDLQGTPRSDGMPQPPPSGRFRHHTLAWLDGRGEVIKVIPR